MSDFERGPARCRGSRSRGLFGRGDRLARLAACVLLAGPSEARADAAVGPVPCTADEIRLLCATATPAAPTVEIACHIDFATLDCERAAGRPNVLTKRLSFTGPAASGVVVDLNGAHVDAGVGTFHHGRGDIVEIRSTRQTDGRWLAPVDVTLRDVSITGSLRVTGMGRNGEATPVRDSSRRSGHVARLRDAAPRDVRLERLEIIATGRTPLYLAPGVSNVTLVDSTIGGRSMRVAVYLDTESSSITLADNRIGVETPDAAVFGFYDRGWPQVALDASSEARIVGNRFTRPDEGGIYLYRNCGEGGTVRHGSPSGNLIAGNVFVYDAQAVRPDPAVLVGSRDYGWWEDLAPGSHCDDDRRPLDGAAGAVESSTARVLRPSLRVGSAVSNRDHARDNRVVGNRLVWQGDARERPARNAMIRLTRSPGNTGNVVRGNRWSSDEAIRRADDR